MRLRLRLGLALAALAMTGVAVPAGAVFYALSCVQLEAVKQDRTSLCRKVISSRERFLAKIRRGAVEEADVNHLVHLFSEGAQGCPKMPNLAFALLDAHLGEPLPIDTPSYHLARLLSLMHDQVPPERVREIRGLAWAADALFLRSYCEPRVWWGYPPGWTPEEADAHLTDPTVWELALRNYGEDSQRDKLVLDALTDRSDPRFDRQKAVELISKIDGPSDRLRGAILATDLTLGQPDFAKAEQLLSWYSPYIENKLDNETNATARAIWVRIAQNMLGSDEPEVRARGEAILLQNDPQAIPSIDPASFVPSGEPVTILDTWPDNLPRVGMRKGAQEGLERNYPARARRLSQGGVVRAAILFGPDGSFEDIAILQSRGEWLDYGTRKIFERYYRPRISMRSLKGYSGQFVLVPLPEVEWRIGREYTEVTDERLIISSRHFYEEILH
jgi:hypothetical protein